MGTEKVAEQHILAKCSLFGVICNLFRAATGPITHLAIDLHSAKTTKIYITQETKKKSKLNSVEVTSDLLISKLFNSY